MTDPVPSKGTCTDCRSTGARDGKIVHKDGCSHMEIVRAPLPSKELVQRFLDWRETPEGKAAAEASERRIQETEALLAKGGEIPWEKLHEPFTI